MSVLHPEIRIPTWAAVAVVAAAYVVLQRRRSRFALRFSSLELFDGVAPDRPGWRRHVAAAAYLAALEIWLIRHGKSRIEH